MIVFIGSAFDFLSYTTFVPRLWLLRSFIRLLESWSLTFLWLCFCLSFIFLAEPFISSCNNQMKSNDGNVVSHILPKRSLLPNGLFSGSLALEAFSCITKFTEAMLCWFSQGNNNNINLQKMEISNYQWSCDERVKSCCYPNFSLFHIHNGSKDLIPALFGNISKSTIQHFVNEAERLHSCSVLSLAVSLM